MRLTRLTLFYPVCYLMFPGLLMMIAPDLALRLLFSNGQYGDVLPRMVGVLMVGLGYLVYEIANARVPALYRALIVVRLFFLPCWIALFLYSRDPMFLGLFCVVGLGFVMSLLAYRHEKE